MNQRRWKVAVILGVAAFLFSSCQKTSAIASLNTPSTSISTDSSSTLAPTQTLVPVNLDELSGRLIVEAGADLVQITIPGGTASAAQQTLATNTVFAGLSPDGTSLLYYSMADQAVKLLNLASGTTKTLLNSAHINCLSWSPTGQRFSLVDDNKLEVMDTNGTVTVLPYTPPSAKYIWENGTGSGTTYYGAFDCGVWMSADSFIFQRTATMPQNLDDMVYDTSTLVDLSGSEPKLTDAPQRWYVADACPQKNLVLLGNQNNIIYLAQPFKDFNHADMKQLPAVILSNDTNLMSKHWLGFIPNSGCEMYFQIIALSSQPGTVELLDPEHLDTPNSLSMTGTMEFPAWQGVWLDEPARRVVALTESSGYSTDGQNIALLDLLSGKEKILINIPASEATVLGWVK